ncbi:hypothetical protein K1T71_007892 [Dendrolimus kikuchii]|uniref:Uncharacterized protein n=1 Tax=Dendrolimus kikuchii TaxID=765133 RepID=A0ACC1CZF3_9NEOP|nr:hypothetical protein K1T71_007892 [Dendrolimus kikuchii]
MDDIDSDHRPVILRLGPQTDQTSETRTSVDWLRLETLLKATSSQDLDRIPDHIVSRQDTETAIEALTSHLQSAVRNSSRQVPVEDDRHLCLPDEVRVLLREKRAASRAHDRYPTEDNRVRLRELEREVKLRIREVREQRWDRTLRDIEPTHQAYWKLARALKSDTLTVIPALERADNTEAFDDEEKAECLAQSLELQCSPTTQNVDQSHLTEVDSEVERRSSLPAETTLDTVTVEEVQDLIKSLKPRKAPGTDGINNRVLKLLPAHLIIILVSIFNAAITNCSFPAIWKEADVIGIHKPGKPANKPSSYRPISLLSALSKLYERVILSRLRDFAFSKHLIPDEQFGFRARHSCVQQVHRITEHILSHFAHRPRPIGTAALFLDVAKAFDKVWHNGLIYKLYQFGMPDRLVLILRDFLLGRSFRFRVEGTRSSPHPLTAGVPQGSALSPLLFTLYTSDIPKTPDVELALFADDTALYTSDQNRQMACVRLQAAVTELGEWFRKWRIEVNPEKSAAMFFSPGTLRSPKRASLRLKTISLYDQQIPWAKYTKYLGVTLDRNLRFNEHITIVRNRARFVMGRLAPMIDKRSKMSLRHKLTLYKTCILPIMTYASVVFGHVKPALLDKLQIVQNKFMRRAVGAPLYMRNVDLHRDLELPSIKNYITSLSRKYFDLAPHHRNPLVATLLRNGWPGSVRPRLEQ